MLVSIIIFPAFILPAMVQAEAPVLDHIKIYSLQYCQETEAVKIDARIPVIKGLGSKTAEEKFNRLIRDKIINFTEEIKLKAEQFLQTYQPEDRPFFKYEAVVVYDLKNTRDILSLVFEFYQYTGGAHGLTTVKSYNLDLESGRDLSLKEFLVRKNLDLALVKGRIEADIAAHPDNYFPGALGYFKNLSDYDYYFEDNSLVVFFQQYDIAPYVAGNPEFKIKLKD